MNGDILIVVGSVIITVWGIGHIIPTRSVVSAFGSLSADNRRILTMEWVAEGLTLCFIGILCVLVTVLAGSATAGAKLLYRACAVMLLVFAAWTIMTGSRTAIVHFKICPVVKTVVAILFVVGSLL